MAACKSVKKVILIHGERKATPLIRSLGSHIEDKLHLGEHVDYKSHFKEDGMAAEILRWVQLVRSRSGEDEGTKGVILVSPQLCDVMKNNKELAQEVEKIILEDLHHQNCRFAFLWTENVTYASAIFLEAFSLQFKEYFTKHHHGVSCDTLPSLADIMNQWFGPATGPGTLDKPELDIETVHIIHGGAKQAVREISRELEDGFQLEETTKYLLYSRVSETQIPKFVLDEVKALVQDGRKALGVVTRCRTLGVIVWCRKLFALMKNSPLRSEFEDLLLVGTQIRLVHLCIGVTQYEIQQDFPKLAPMYFIPIELNEDNTIDVLDLCKRVNIVLGQPGKLPSDKYHFQAKPRLPSDDQKNLSAGEQSPSEISEPRALASEEGQKSQRPMPNQHLGPSLGVIGNPSNQNQQGGRVVPSNFDSHSTSSAGYTGTAPRPAGLQQEGDRVHGQPSDESSGEGQNNQNYKFITNNGDSWNRAPSGYGIDPQSFPPALGQLDCGIGQHRVPGGGASASPPQSSSQSPSPTVASGVHGQTAQSDSSTDCSRYLADGEHSMPMQSMRSYVFGSQMPVLPPRDATVEVVSDVSGGAPQGVDQQQPVRPTNLSNAASGVMNVSLPLTSHFPQRAESSSGPATNKWAPSDYPSTEMPGPDIPHPNEVAIKFSSDRDATKSMGMPRVKEQPASQWKALYSLEDANQRPAASKIPRRMNSEDFRFSSSSCASSQTHSSPHSQHQNELCRGTYSTDNSTANSPANSQAQTFIPSQNMNISGLASVLTGQSQQKPFVQCTADEYHGIPGSNNVLQGGSYAMNVSSANAFKEQDYQELGAGKNLPNNTVDSKFMSLPVGHSLGNGNVLIDGKRLNTSPGRITSPPSESNSQLDNEEELQPPDHPIKDMHYNCRRLLILMLDPETSTGCDWKVFAYHFKMKFELVRFFQSKPSPTHELLNWLIENHTSVTCGMFKEVARKNQRMDVVRKMNKFGY